MEVKRDKWDCEESRSGRWFQKGKFEWLALGGRKLKENGEVSFVCIDPTLVDLGYHLIN